jgi:hypothetical protein
MKVFEQVIGQPVTKDWYNYFVNELIDSDLFTKKDLIGPFSKESKVLLHLKNLKNHMRGTQDPCVIISLPGHSVAGTGAETFHAWLPKIIMFSAYVFGEEKKSIFALENHLCLFN